MSIELVCKNCGQTLRVPDTHAGKQARCPACQAITPIPAAEAQMQVPMSPPPKWSMKTPEGAVYGPVDKFELDRWVAEGRVNAQCQVRSDDSGHWQPAAHVYPALAATATGAVNPFSDEFDPEVQPTAAAAYQPLPARRTVRQAHRGGLLLTLGILSNVFNLISVMSVAEFYGIFCFLPIVSLILGICAWVMAVGDMNSIRIGLMDPTGTGSTQAGLVLGIIGTILGGLLLIGLLLIAASWPSF